MGAMETSASCAVVSEPTLSLHCTLKFDETQSDTDYEECWNEQINSRHFHLITEDIYVGPQGAAAVVRLPDQLSQWFQVKNSVPHVTVMMAKDTNLTNWDQ